MEHMEKRMALRRLRRGDPSDIIRLYTAQIEILKDQYSKTGCKGCSGGFYRAKIKKYEDEIKAIKEDKRFRMYNFNEPKA